MGDNQTNALAVISTGSDALSLVQHPDAASLVQQPSSEYRLARNNASKISSHDFAKDFVFGAGTAALQVEGAYAEGGRSLSNWDAFSLRTPGKILDGSNTTVTIDQYHRYQEDVLLLKKLGFSAYRFSISWSRVLPGGRLSTGKNMEGIKYYNDLIDFCIAQGIEPYVTIFHFELPQALEDEYGGFLSTNILKDYLEFAELCFWEFGDRVKRWVTVNEPFAVATNGYVYGAFPPGRGTDTKKNDSATEPYIVAHNLILAHAYAVDLYRKNYQAVQGGEIGVTHVASWNEPLNEHDHADWEAALRATDFTLGWFVEPLITGQYPATMRKNVGDRLPQFTREQETVVKGSFDFLGFNYYTARYVQNDPSTTTEPQFSTDSQTKSLTERDGVPMGPTATGSTWIVIVPYGIQKILAYAKLKYGDPVIYVTENGVSEANDKSLSVTEALADDTRIRYIQDHLYYIKKAIDEDKVKVKGYFVWALLDNFELASGFTTRFGLVFVDYINGLARYPKKSARWIMNFLNKRHADKKRLRADEDVGDNALPKRLK